MEPERVDGRPGEHVAVVALHDVDRCARHPGPVAEEQAAPRRLHEQHHDKQQHHRRLRREHTDVLGEPVVEQVRLQNVQQDEPRIHGERRLVEPVQPGRVPRTLPLRRGDQPPDRGLVQQVRQPGAHPGDPGGFRQLPVVPGCTLVRQQHNVGEERVQHPDEGGEGQRGDDSPGESCGRAGRGRGVRPGTGLRCHWRILGACRSLMSRGAPPRCRPVPGRRQPAQPRLRAIRSSTSRVASYSASVMPLAISLRWRCTTPRRRPTATPPRSVSM